MPKKKSNSKARQKPARAQNKTDKPKAKRAAAEIQNILPFSENTENEKITEKEFELLIEKLRDDLNLAHWAKLRYEDYLANPIRDYKHGVTESGSEWSSFATCSTESLFRLFFKTLCPHFPPDKSDLLVWQNWLTEKGYSPEQLKCLSYGDAIKSTMLLWIDEYEKNRNDNSDILKEKSETGSKEKDLETSSGVDTLEVPWDETNKNYMQSSEARVNFTDGKLSAVKLSKSIGKIRVRYMRKPGKGCRVHIGEFIEWAKEKYPPDAKRAEIAEEWLADVEARKTEERSKRRFK